MPSSVIEKFYYEQARQQLVIVFVSGMIYTYKKVPETIYNKMKVSVSKGIFFNRFIKDKYLFEKAGDK